MPCGCSTLAPCEVPQLVPVGSYSESHEIVFDAPSIEYGGVPIGPGAVGLVLLIVALSRHFRGRPLCVLNLAGRPVAPVAARPVRPVLRPLRLVLSPRERAFFGRLSAAARSLLAWSVPMRPLAPSRSSPPSRPS
jgi:hypothetical protein